MISRQDHRSSLTKYRRLLQTIFVSVVLFFLLSTVSSSGFADEMSVIPGWTLTAPLPNALADAQTVAVSGTLYAVGGKTATTSINQVAVAKIANDGSLPIWQTIASSLPISPYLHSVVAVENRIFSIGGYDDKQRFSTVYSATVQDGGSLSGWTAVNDLPLKLVLHSAATLHTCIFVVGGVSENNAPLKTVFHTNVDGDTLSYWAQDPQELPEARFRATASAYEYKTDTSLGFLYLVGGFDGAATSRKVFMSKVMNDCSLGKWQTVRELPKLLHYHASVIYNQRLFVLGGKNESAESADVYSAGIDATGALGAWQSEPGLPLTLYRLVAVVAPLSQSCPSFLYVLGGLHSQIYQSQVYRSSLSSCYQYLPLIQRSP